MAAGFKQATINASDVPSTQTNFPAYVDLSRLGITTLAEAQSVRCYSDAAKTTELAREIVSVSEMHVKIPSLTSTFTLYVDWDGTSSEYAVTDTYGRNNVWTDYDIVLHADGLVDSTGKRTITEFGTVSYTAGQIGDGFSYGTSYPRTADAADLDYTSNFYLSCWVKRTSTTTRDTIISKNSWTVNTGYWIFFGDGGNTLNINTPGSSFSVFTMTSSFTTGSFQHMVIKKTGGVDFKSYRNGAIDATVAQTGNFRVNATEVRFGQRFDFSDPFLGTIDELRLTDTLFSDDWIETEYNNQNDEATFWGTWTDAGAGGPAFIPKVTTII